MWIFELKVYCDFINSQLLFLVIKTQSTSLHLDKLMPKVTLTLKAMRFDF